MIEITCTKKQGELKIGMKDKNGETVIFSYGVTIDEKMIDKDMLKQSMETGLLSAYLKKGWAVKGKVNVNNKIIGAPVKFEQIEKGVVVGEQTINKVGEGIVVGQQEFNKPMEIKSEHTIVKIENKDKGVTSDIADVINANSNVAKTEQPITATATETPKKRGRPAKVVDIKEVVADAKVEEPAVIEPIKKAEEFD